MEGPSQTEGPELPLGWTPGGKEAPVGPSAGHRSEHSSASTHILIVLSGDADLWAEGTGISLCKFHRFFCYFEIISKHRIK